jgi:hypothetical protein
MTSMSRRHPATVSDIFSTASSVVQLNAAAMSSLSWSRLARMLASVISIIRLVPHAPEVIEKSSHLDWHAPHVDERLLTRGVVETEATDDRHVGIVSRAAVSERAALTSGR